MIFFYKKSLGHDLGRKGCIRQDTEGAAFNAGGLGESLSFRAHSKHSHTCRTCCMCPPTVWHVQGSLPSLRCQITASCSKSGINKLPGTCVPRTTLTACHLLHKPRTVIGGFLLFFKKIFSLLHLGIQWEGFWVYCFLLSRGTRMSLCMSTLFV